MEPQSQESSAHLSFPEGLCHQGRGERRRRQLSELLSRRICQAKEEGSDLEQESLLEACREDRYRWRILNEEEDTTILEERETVCVHTITRLCTIPSERNRALFTP